MDVLREREVKDSLERQLLDEQKIRGKQGLEHIQTILLHCSMICIVFNAIHCFKYLERKEKEPDIVLCP